MNTKYNADIYGEEVRLNLRNCFRQEVQSHIDALFSEGESFLMDLRKIEDIEDYHNYAWPVWVIQYDDAELVFVHEETAREKFIQMYSRHMNVLMPIKVLRLGSTFKKQGDRQWEIYDFKEAWPNIKPSPIASAQKPLEAYEEE